METIVKKENGFLAFYFEKLLQSIESFGSEANMT